MNRRAPLLRRSLLPGVDRLGGGRARHRRFHSFSGSEMPSGRTTAPRRLQGAHEAAEATHISQRRFPTAAGDWVACWKATAFTTSNVNLPACRKLTELQKARNTFQCVAFCTCRGLDGALEPERQTGPKAQVPDEAFKKMQEVVNGGGHPAFGRLRSQRRLGRALRPDGHLVRKHPDDLAKFSTTPSSRV